MGKDELRRDEDEVLISVSERLGNTTGHFRRTADRLAGIAGVLGSKACEVGGNSQQLGRIARLFRGKSETHGRTADWLGCVSGTPGAISTRTGGMSSASPQHLYLNYELRRQRTAGARPDRM